VSAVVFIDVVEPGSRAEEVVAAIKRTAPAAYVGVAGTERIEVFFSGPDVDEEGARRTLETAIGDAGEDAGSFVKVVF
jgi:sarcosine oxidase gamma subunit